MFGNCSYRILAGSIKSFNAHCLRLQENLPSPSCQRIQALATKRNPQAEQRKQQESVAMVTMGHHFNDIPNDKRNKDAFNNALGLFLQRNITRRGHVEFIYAALKYMKEFGVHRDLECYKRLLEVFPKGKMIPTNILQASLKHYPKHQDCCIRVLDQLEASGVLPDKELYQIVENAFGSASLAMRKMKRIMYWMPKFKHANPYPVPFELPKADLDLAKLAVERMCRDPSNEINVWYTEAIPDSKEHTWIVSGQSIHQRNLIKEHDETQAIYVDGPYREWMSSRNLSYFVLRSDPKTEMAYEEVVEPEPETSDEWASWSTKFTAEIPHGRRELIKSPTIHDQSDGTILALAVTGTGSKDSLACWINFLQAANPKLAKIPVLFRLSHPSAELATMDPQSQSTPKPTLLDSS